MQIFSSFFALLFLSNVTHLCFADDTLYSGQSLSINQTLVSKRGNFELGFFKPGNSSNFYIGIWYKKISVQNKTYVWVANRDTPISDPIACKLQLLVSGDLVLYNQSKIVVWSTNTTSTGMNSSLVVLGDDGNLILRSRFKPFDVYWESFDYPTDTWLPGGRIRYDNIRRKTQSLPCWTSPNNPSPGLFSLELEPIGDQYIIKWNETQTYWSTGSWDGQIFKGLPSMKSNNVYNFSYVKNEKESYFTYTLYNTSMISRFVMDISGQVKVWTWVEAMQEWFLVTTQPMQQCEVYAFCGAFGVCSENGVPVCNCMEGFQPRSPKDWGMSDFSSGGCVRKSALKCGRKDTFFTISNVNLPVNAELLAVGSAERCKSICVNNCSCNAYAYRNGCTLWDRDLLSLQKVSGGNETGVDLYFRLAVSNSKNSGAGEKTWIIVGVIAAAVAICFIAFYIIVKRKTNRKGGITISQEKDLELPLFDLVTVETATSSFAINNKIGQGGFGPVYKGVLPSGEEIAIKKLSKDSRQGLDEFMNEVILIAKLQHRNLVRLLGCCIHGDERMLIYEYMPNKSLDVLIFEKERGVNLDWDKRFDIIVGIARGLLYLHRDSRLRIIHRDLKAEMNPKISDLLDAEMNPKISDFGMARILGGSQTEENTMRIVGTYGYMSPEYATDGIFSMKSDVFSFGVLVLEIVNGNRNRGFHHADHDLNLLGHTWNLLNDKKSLELLDPTIAESATSSEVLKCIQVGLLCVQKFPEDRPSMSSVVSMLDGDGVMLPWPKEPGFYTERGAVQNDAISTQGSTVSNNDLSITFPHGR